VIAIVELRALIENQALERFDVVRKIAGVEHSASLSSAPARVKSFCVIARDFFTLTHPC
jgi:hypothetical protein